MTTENTIEKILEKHGITYNQLICKIRKRPFVRARKECAKVLHDQNWSYASIARLLNRDPSTVLHHIKPTPSHRRKVDNLKIDVTRNQSI